MITVIVACSVASGALGAEVPAPPAPAAVQAAPVPPGGAPSAAMHAADAPAAPLPTADGALAVTGSVGAWFTRITGTAKVGASGTTFQLNQDLAIDENNAGVATEFAVAVGRWRFGGIGFWTQESGSQSAPTSGTFGNTAISAGDRISGSYSAWMAGGEVQYAIWHPTGDTPWAWDAPGTNAVEAARFVGSNGRPLFDAQFLLIGGALGLHYEESLTNDTAGGSSGFDRTVASVYGGAGLDVRIGLDGRVPLLQDLRVHAEAGAGPTIPGGQLVWMVRVGFAGMVTPNVGVEFGYRLFDFDLVDGPSEVNAGLRGLFAGMTVRF
jgi:hypothetical protein